MAPARASRPVPPFVRLVATPESAITEAIVRSPAVLFCVTARSPADPASVPPVIVERLPPTPGVTRMPPSTVLAPASASVCGTAEANRRLPAAIAPARFGELLTSTFAPR